LLWQQKSPVHIYMCWTRHRVDYRNSLTRTPDYQPHLAREVVSVTHTTRKVVLVTKATPKVVLLIYAIRIYIIILLFRNLSIVLCAVFNKIPLPGREGVRVGVSEKGVDPVLRWACQVRR